MKVRYYTANHPMLLARSGDPARGEWKPWAGKQKSKPKRRKAVK